VFFLLLESQKKRINFEHMDEKFQFDFSNSEDQIEFENLPSGVKKILIEKKQDEASKLKKIAKKISWGGENSTHEPLEHDYEFASEILRTKENIEIQDSKTPTIEKMKDFFILPENKKILADNPNNFLHDYIFYLEDIDSPESEQFKSGYEVIQRLLVERQAGNIFEISRVEMLKNGFSEQEASALEYIKIKLAVIITNLKHDEEEGYLIHFLEETNPRIFEEADKAILDIIRSQKENSTNAEVRATGLLKERYNFQGSEDGPKILSGKPETAQSYTFGDALGGLLYRWQMVSRPEYKDKFYDSMLEGTYKDNVVIEIGPGGQWIMEGEIARRIGASQYIGIDINEKLGNTNIDRRVERKTAEGKKIDKMFLVIDDPINFLSNLDDHSVTFVSCNVFSEPMRKNLDYSKKLCNLVLQKARFQAHYGDSSPYKFSDPEGGESFINLRFKKIDGADVSIYCPELKDLKEAYMVWSKSIRDQSDEHE
jgi:hypothetical protein